MKKQFFTLGLILFSMTIHAQTSIRKNNLEAGGGMEYYKGDLGNSFLAFDEEWYGVIRVAYNRYLTPSFDAQGFATIGEIGRCFDGPLDPEHPVLMLRSRFSTAGLGLKYKFSNGYLLKKEAKIAPYVYAGAALSHHQDIWTNEPRVNEGFYTSLNAGLGVSVKLTQNIRFVYNLGLGYFTTDTLDFITKGANDMYLQNTIALGYDF